MADNRSHSRSSSSSSSSNSVDEYIQRKNGRPKVSVGEAESIYRARFLGEGQQIASIKSLDSYDDANFEVELTGSASPATVVLKIHNAVDSLQTSLLESQTKLLESLRECSVKCPSPVKAPVFLDLPVAVGGKAKLAVRANEFVKGEVMEAKDSGDPALLEKLGIVFGRLSAYLNDDNANSPVNKLGGEMNRGGSHVWDLARFADLRGYLKYVKDDSKRELVMDVLSAFEEEVVPSSDHFQLGLIHGDLNDANVILSPNRKEVAGVIDFGDSCHSWLVSEVAIAMAYVMLSSPPNEALGAAAVLLHGFIQGRGAPIPPAESRLLRILVAARLAQSATLGAFALSVEPENAEYLSRHSEPAWSTLRLLWEELAENQILALWEKSILLVGVETLVKVSGVKRNRAAETLLPASERREMRSVVFVTGNENKLKEVKAILGSSLVSLTHEALDLPELQGDPHDICKQKCLIAFQQLKGVPVLVEDTSLCFSALKGLPGPYIKHFLEKTGHEGLVNLLRAYEDKSAYAQCIFGFCENGKEVKLFEGRTHGSIVPPRVSPGRKAFGWDPIFEPLEGEGGKTFAEMSPEAKNAISHRYKALDKCREHLLSLQRSMKHEAS